MFSDLVDEIFWGARISEFDDFIDLGESESKAPQNEKVEIFHLEFKDKKIFEDMDGEYVDFIEL